MRRFSCSEPSMPRTLKVCGQLVLTKFSSYPFHNWTALYRFWQNLRYWCSIPFEEMAVFSVTTSYLIYCGWQVMIGSFTGLEGPLAMSTRWLRKTYRAAVVHSSHRSTFDLVNAKYISRPCGSDGDAVITVQSEFNLLICSDSSFSSWFTVSIWAMIGYLVLTADWFTFCYQSLDQLPLLSLSWFS